MATLINTLTCAACDQPRPPGRSRCSACINAERRDLYQGDYQHRSREKSRHNQWRAEHLQERAVAQRAYRARRKLRLSPVIPTPTPTPEGGAV